MVVHDFHVMRIPAAPSEADSPPVIDADAMLPLSVASQGLETITWRNPQELQICRSVELNKLTQGHPLDIARKPSGSLTLEQLLGIPVCKALDHVASITQSANNVKR